MKLNIEEGSKAQKAYDDLPDHAIFVLSDGDAAMQVVLNKEEAFQTEYRYVDVFPELGGESIGNFYQGKYQDDPVPQWTINF